MTSPQSMAARQLRSRARALRRFARLAAVALAVAAWPGLATAADLEILTLSNRADLVSGDDVLVEVVIPSGIDPANVRVSLNGADVTSAFAVRPDGRFSGLVGGL